jgi:hypothetical protein
MATAKKDKEKVKKASSTKAESGGRSTSFEDLQLEIPNEEYNLVSILYHALQGAETYIDYVEDAEDSGDEELASFFKDVQQEEIRRAERAKQLLAMRLSGTKNKGGRRRTEEEEEFEEGASM